jgi:hypothetical protein
MTRIFAQSLACCKLLSLRECDCRRGAAAVAAQIIELSSNIMTFALSNPNQFHLIGLLLLGGVALFGAASFLASPFEQAKARPLYEAINKHYRRYVQMNLLAAGGVIVLFAGFFLLADLIWDRSQPGAAIGSTLLGLAMLFWLAEVTIRMTVTAATARSLINEWPSRTHPAIRWGIGFNPIVLVFLGAAVIGMALLIWSMGEAGLLSTKLTRAGVLILVSTGMFSACEYRWMGGVERILFHPLIGVIAPLALVVLSGSLLSR